MCTGNISLMPMHLIFPCCLLLCSFHFITTLPDLSQSYACSLKLPILISVSFMLHWALWTAYIQVAAVLLTQLFLFAQTLRWAENLPLQIPGYCPSPHIRKQYFRGRTGSILLVWTLVQWPRNLQVSNSEYADTCARLVPCITADISNFLIQKMFQ